jgi:hypothetical protein
MVETKATLKLADTRESEKSALRTPPHPRAGVTVLMF